MPREKLTLKIVVDKAVYEQQRSVESSYQSIYRGPLSPHLLSFPSGANVKIESSNVTIN